MNWLRGIIAFVLAFALAFATSRMANGPALATSTRAPLIASDAIDADRVNEIVLERDGTVYRFERQDGSWLQTAPILHAVENWSMRQLIGRVLKTVSVRTVDLSTSDGDARAKSLVQAGLSPPSGRIELKEQAAAGAAARSVTIDLGRRSLAGRAYARVGAQDGKVDDTHYQVVDSELHEFALGRDPKEFRRRDLFIDLKDVDRVAFRSTGNELVLTRQGKVFRLESPVKTRVDRVQAEELFDALRRAKSSGFVSDKPAELAAYGLSPAMATLEVDSGSTRRTLLIGDTVSIGAQDRFGMLDGTSTVVRLPAAVLAPIFPRVERLIDAVASAIRPRDIAAIEIAVGAQHITLRRETSGWTASVATHDLNPATSPATSPTTSPATSPASIAGTIDLDAADRLLKALTETRAASVELSAFPASDSVATVTFLGFASEPLDTVRIARRVSDSKTLLENGDGVLRVHGSIDLPLTAEELGFHAK